MLFITNRVFSSGKSLALCMLVFFLPTPLLAANNLIIPASPTIAARGYFLMDFDSGQILTEKNADDRLAPASLTKIMSTYVVFQELQAGQLALDEPVIISKKAWKTPGSKMFIEVNKHVSVEDLLKGVIIQSGNDASVALAEHIAGDEETFARLMNQHAKRLGMINSNFHNSTGLPAKNHYTTAHDLAILSQALIREFPDYYQWFKEKDFTFNNIKQSNRNKLLWRDDSVDGIKTGYTEKAGYCLVASAKRNNMRLISVVMGTRNQNARARENQNLLNYGFRFFETHKLYDAQQKLTEAKVWKGATNILSLGINDDLYVTVPRRHYDDLKAVMSVDSRIIAPVGAGQTFGSIAITLQDETIIQKPLVALSPIAIGSIFQKLYDTVLLKAQ
ncbi:MAG: D-alanyl-D-alanine carboxypeptidase [Methylococcales bacterium]|nr:D-alanyl-D-alanine carboxypeptidase [Methylococcales bacterium]MBT3699188.1 D-alanyl-D-alanine carboxypeptidase [Methylococcales bacterium]MBT4033093.1 D-alanyl-D-alanine carboxypeptidase [Methylococcales bacterium]MBT4349051.1 D-alanyl-D-alanine carboxypeptidase [Methylococcales bacterium]MBT4598443.1 D-alanyl-D-alanine carboxypeptidase [Methylococcales bacterium]